MNDETGARSGPSGGDQAGRTAETEQDLKSTSDSILIDIGRLATVEDQKMALDPEDPRVDALSDEAVDLADRIARETRAERQLSDELG